MDKGEGEVLVEEVAQELAHAQVGPAAMHQQEALQEAELGEGVVAGQHGLHALLTGDAYADVSRWVQKDRRRERMFLIESFWTLFVMFCFLVWFMALFTPLIMLTSLAPSPMASVTAFLYFLTSSTT